MKIAKQLLMLVTIFLTIFSLTAFAEGRGNDRFGSGVSSMPPGLENKGMPYGLEKQGKTPHGWSQGKKVGWYKHKHHHHIYPIHFKKHGRDQ